MSKIPCLLVVSLLGAAALAQPVAAQGVDRALLEALPQGPSSWDKARLYAGAGVQFLSLPDINFTGIQGPNGLRRQENSDSDWLDAGGAADFGFAHPLGWWGGYRVVASIDGFFSNVEVDNTTRCDGSPTSFCVAIDPTGGIEITPQFTLGGQIPTLVTTTDRDTDYWGGQVEFKIGRPDSVQVKPDVYRNDYFLAGFDVRGIDQDNRLHGEASNQSLFKYDESLDVTYYGGYIGFGGEYSFGFIPGLKSVGGFYDRLGIRTYINATAGLYDAQTDYSGRFWSAPGTTNLSESENELAFIGTVSLEARKQVGVRTSLSLFTDYEYISSVPQMRYADFGGTTRIEDDDIFASRTTLRLNIGLGPDELYTERERDHLLRY